MRLEQDTQAESEIPGINYPPQGIGAGDRIVSIQALHRAIGIQLEVRHTRDRVTEVRRVADVEALRANLNLDALSDAEIAEDIQIEIGESRSAKTVKPRIAKGSGSDWGEGQRIEIRLATQATAYDGHIGQNLICRLRASGTITGSRR